jgi:3D (Asp-Asp-Asp) domain-containing protein
MSTFINKTEDGVPSKRRLWAWNHNINKRKLNFDKFIIKIDSINKDLFSLLSLIILLSLNPNHIDANYLKNASADNINKENLIFLSLSNENIFYQKNYGSTVALNNNWLSPEDNANNLNQFKFNYQKIALNSEKSYKKIYLWITAYSSSPDETDEDPFITASNTITRDGIVATNILPFGTKIKIPSLFGNKIFTVEDRMHERKTNFIDIWMESKEKALRFGIHYAEVLILEKESELAQK